MNVMNIFHEDKTQFVALTQLTTFRRAPGWFLRKIFALFQVKKIAFILFYFLHVWCVQTCQTCAGHIRNSGYYNGASVLRLVNIFYVNVICIWCLPNSLTYSKEINFCLQ